MVASGWCDEKLVMRLHYEGGAVEKEAADTLERAFTEKKNTRRIQEDEAEDEKGSAAIAAVDDDRGEGRMAAQTREDCSGGGGGGSVQRGLCVLLCGQV